MALIRKEALTVGQDKEMDRVCGMWMDIKDNRLTSVYKEETYYFCSEGCKAKFDHEPEYYRRGVEDRKP